MKEYCPVCETFAVMVTPEALAIVSGVSERSIFRLIEANEIHFLEGPKVYVCMNSLRVQKERKNQNRSIEK